MSATPAAAGTGRQTAGGEGKAASNREGLGAGTRPTWEGMPGEGARLGWLGRLGKGKAGGWEGSRRLPGSNQLTKAQCGEGKTEDKKKMVRVGRYGMGSL